MSKVEEIVRVGASRPLGAEFRITAEEMDRLLHCKDINELRETEIYKACKLVREVHGNKSVRKVGQFDESRLNWE